MFLRLTDSRHLEYSGGCFSCLVGNTAMKFTDVKLEILSIIGERLDLSAAEIDTLEVQVPQPHLFTSNSAK